MPAGPPPTTATCLRVPAEAKSKLGSRPHRRVDQAGDVALARDPRFASLVAADAPDDLLQAPVARLVGKLGVGEERAAERDQVDPALGDRAVRQARVHDPAGPDHGDA